MAQRETIDLAELRRLSDRLFQRLERGGVHRIAVQAKPGHSHNRASLADDDAFAVRPGPAAGGVFDRISALRSDAAAIPSDDPDIVFWRACHDLSGLMLFLARADKQGTLAGSPAEGDGS